MRDFELDALLADLQTTLNGNGTDDVTSSSTHVTSQQNYQYRDDDQSQQVTIHVKVYQIEKGMCVESGSATNHCGLPNQVHLVIWCFWCSGVLACFSSRQRTNRRISYRTEYGHVLGWSREQPGPASLLPNQPTNEVSPSFKSIQIAWAYSSSPFVTGSNSLWLLRFCWPAISSQTICFV